MGVKPSDGKRSYPKFGENHSPKIGSHDFTGLKTGSIDAMKVTQNGCLKNGTTEVTKQILSIKASACELGEQQKTKGSKKKKLFYIY